MTDDVLNTEIKDKELSPHGGDVYSLDKPYKIMDYSININPFGVPKTLKRAINRSFPKLEQYPDTKNRKATEIIAKHHLLNKNNIVIGNGATELIYLAIQTIKPRKALIPMPTFTEYQRSCKMIGCEVIPYELKKEEAFELIIDDFIAKIDNSIDMVIICNPNNPTSKIISKNSMKKLLEFCQPKGIYIMIDEAFVDFTLSDISVIGYIKKYANLIIIRSLTKFFAVPGLRIGYAVACESLTQLFIANKYPWSVNYFASIVCEISLKDSTYINKTKKWLNQEPKRFYDLLCTLSGIKVYKPNANYILIEVEKTLASIMAERLLNKGIFIRDASNFKFLDAHFIRIAIKDKKSNDKFFDKFSMCLL